MVRGALPNRPKGYAISYAFRDETLNAGTGVSGEKKFSRERLFLSATLREGGMGGAKFYVKKGFQAAQSTLRLHSVLKGRTARTDPRTSRGKGGN